MVVLLALFLIGDAAVDDVRVGPEPVVGASTSDEDPSDSGSVSRDPGREQEQPGDGSVVGKPIFSLEQPHAIMAGRVADRFRESSVWSWPGLLDPDDDERDCIATGIEDQPSILLADHEDNHWDPDLEPLAILELLEACTSWVAVRDHEFGPDSSSWLVPGMADVVRTRVCREFTHRVVAHSGWEGDEVGLACGVEVDRFWTLSLISMRFPDFAGEVVGGGAGGREEGVSEGASVDVEGFIRRAVLDSLAHHWTVQERDVCSDGICRDGYREDGTDLREVVSGGRFPARLWINGDVDRDDDILSLMVGSISHHVTSNDLIEGFHPLHVDRRSGRSFELPDLFGGGDDWWWPVARAFEVSNRWWVAEGGVSAPSPPADPGWWIAEMVLSGGGRPTMTLSEVEEVFYGHRNWPYEWAGTPYPVAISLDTIRFVGTDWTFPGECCGGDPGYLDVPWEAFLADLDPDGPGGVILQQFANRN